MAQPPAKRMKLAVPVGVGGGEPKSRRLRHTLLVVLFMVRVSVRATVPASISQLGGMFQRHVDHAFRRYHEMISSELETLQGKVESKLETFQEQVDGLRHEVRQLSRLCSNRHADQQIRVEPNKEHAASDGSNTNTRLCFLNALKLPIYTDKNITAENGAAIKVAMFEGEKMITSGPLSNVKVEILVLRGDFSNNCRDNWTEEDFDKHIVEGRDGQGLVLGTAWLTNGEVELSQTRFKEGSCRTPSRKFIMAARVCKSKKTTVRVQEAIMQPVTVLDRRNEPNEKRYPPRLDDGVYRLEEIAKNGAYYKRLHEAGISTVQGFLKALNKDSSKLRKILKMEKQHNSWTKLIEHAKECVFEDKQELKRYHSQEGNLVFFFDCVHNLVGAAFPIDYVACKEFDQVQKALVDKWKPHAYDKLEDILPDHVMKGSVPEPIFSSTDVAAGPSVLPVGASQPVSSAEHLAAYQGYLGTGAAANSLHSGINHVIPPIYPNANSDPMIACPGYLNTNGYQDQGLLGQEQVIPGPILPGCQQNPGNVMNHFSTFEVSENYDNSLAYPLLSGSIADNLISCSRLYNRFCRAQTSMDHSFQQDGPMATITSAHLPQCQESTPVAALPWAARNRGALSMARKPAALCFQDQVTATTASKRTGRT